MFFVPSEVVYILFYVTFFYICWQTNESAVRLFFFFFSLSSSVLLHSWTRVFWCHRSVFLNTFTPLAMTSCFYQIASKVSNSSEIHSRFSQDILFKMAQPFFFFFKLVPLCICSSLPTFSFLFSRLPYCFPLYRFCFGKLIPTSCVRSNLWAFPSPGWLSR